MASYIDMLPIAPRLREPLRAAFRGERAAWPELTANEIAALEEHGLVPLAYRAGATSLRELAIEAAVVEPLRLRDLRALLDALTVPLLILKGTALAYDLYDAPELRPRGDVDLLIDVRDVDRVRDTLLGLGFIERITSGDELGIRQASFSRAAEHGVEHLYDVHWDITNMAVFAGTLTFGELFARSRPLPRIHERARGLADADALLLACVHRVAHHHDSERLIWLYDIHLLRERMSRDEHARFWRTAAERRVVAVCERSIDLADAWAGVAPHDRAADHLERIPPDEPSRLFLDRQAARGALLAAELKALPGWPARLQRMRQLAFPPREFIRAQFPNHGAAMLPVLYAWRGLRAVARLFRRVAGNPHPALRAPLSHPAGEGHGAHSHAAKRSGSEGASR